MLKVSKESAQVEDHGVVEDRHGEGDGYTINFVTFREEIDSTPMLKGLPDDRCQCPHWGYVLKGRLTFGFADGDEVFEAGDAFYVPAGHTQSAEGGSEYLQFSPTAELKETEAVIMKNMQETQAY
jgi:mannose-6-phosphate isomerase-like protein (cupin superfamily)